MLHVISAFIIAGGRSSRMGRDKALLRLGDAGPTLLERAIELARTVTKDVQIVGQKELFESWAALSLTQDNSANPTLRQNQAKGWGTPDPGSGVDIGDSSILKFGNSAIEDIFPGQGPLAGIHAALRASASELNLMLAVDTPFVEPRFLRYLVDEARKSGAIVTVPVTGDRCSVIGDRQLVDKDRNSQEHSRSYYGSQENSSRASTIDSRSASTGSPNDKRDEPTTQDQSSTTHPDHRSPTTEHRSQHQPLCAVYRRSFADIAETALRERRNNIVPLFQQVSTRSITEDELRKLAFDPRMFDNLNTPEDWERAKDRM